MTDPAMHDLADRLFRALEANDADTIAACCSPDAEFFKNGARSGSLADMLPAFATLRSRVGDHRYTDVRREVFAGGFVEEHRVVSTLPDGSPLDVVACVIGRTDDSGRIAVLAEYVDTNATRSAS